LDLAIAIPMRAKRIMIIVMHQFITVRVDLFLKEYPRFCQLMLVGVHAASTFGSFLNKCIF